MIYKQVYLAYDPSNYKYYFFCLLNKRTLKNINSVKTNVK